MRCQDIERLILESEERELSGEERLALDEHLARCASCTGFNDFCHSLRITSPNGPEQDLPAEVDQRVRRLCHQELNKKSAGVPWMIWAALALLMFLTIDFLIPRVEEFWQNQKVTLEMGLVIILLLQNALMLFFAPVIIRRPRYWNITL
jgi:hypothetical protein